MLHCHLDLIIYDILNHHMDHLLYTPQKLTFKVCPTFRPDSYVLLNEQSFEEKVEKLDAVTDGTITDLNSYINALKARFSIFVLLFLIGPKWNCTTHPRE